MAIGNRQAFCAPPTSCATVRDRLELQAPVTPVFRLREADAAREAFHLAANRAIEMSPELADELEAA